jgi:ABC-type uncharacterized transport system ATPase subunit
VPALTVGENLALATGRSVGQSVRRSPSFLAGLDLAARVEDLSVGLKQRLEVAKALATGARILLLDEPTAVLVPSEIEELLRAMRAFAAEGGAVVLITHKLDEVFAAADSVTVLRRGRTAHTGPIDGQTREGLAQAMIGESLLPVSPTRDARLGTGIPTALGMPPSFSCAMRPYHPGTSEAPVFEAPPNVTPARFLASRRSRGTGSAS